MITMAQIIALTLAWMFLVALLLWICRHERQRRAALMRELMALRTRLEGKHDPPDSHALQCYADVENAALMRAIALTRGSYVAVEKERSH